MHKLHKNIGKSNASASRNRIRIASHLSHGVGLAIWKSSRANTCKTHYKCTQFFLSLWWCHWGQCVDRISVARSRSRSSSHPFHSIYLTILIRFHMVYVNYAVCTVALWHCTLHSTILASTKIRLRFRQEWMYFIALHRFRLNMMFVHTQSLSWLLCFPLILLSRLCETISHCIFDQCFWCCPISCWKSSGGGGVQTWCIIYRAENRLKDQIDDFSMEKNQINTNKNEEERKKNTRTEWQIERKPSQKGNSAFYQRYTICLDWMVKLYNLIFFTTAGWMLCIMLSGIHSRWHTHIHSETKAFHWKLAIHMWWT